MKRITIIVLLLIITQVANAQQFIKTAKKKYHSIERGDVVVYIDQSNVPKDAENVGLIVCSTNSDKYAYKKAKKLAAKNGANGLYLQKVKEASKGEKTVDALFGTYHPDKMTFVAVYVPETFENAGN